MAIVVESITTGAWQGVNNGNNLSISKPSGLAEGDLLLAIVGMNSSANVAFDMEAITNGGWTDYAAQLSDTGSNTRVAITVSYKVATSSDVASSTFAFRNNSSANVGMGGSLLRISGHGVEASIQNDTDEDTSDTTPTYTGGLTPAYPNSLLLFGVVGTYTVANSVTTSGYAIATDDPSWTEQSDISGDLAGFFGSGSGVGPWLAVASAVRPETTATGDFSCAFSNSVSYSAGILIAIAPQSDADGNHVILTSPHEIFATGISVSTTANHDRLDMDSTLNNHTTKIVLNRWTNTEKGNKSWINQKK